MYIRKAPDVRSKGVHSGLLVRQRTKGCAFGLHLDTDTSVYHKKVERIALRRKEWHLHPTENCKKKKSMGEECQCMSSVTGIHSVDISGSFLIYGTGTWNFLKQRGRDILSVLFLSGLFIHGKCPYMNSYIIYTSPGM